MTLRALFLTAILVLCAGVQALSACQCPSRRSVYESFAEATVVFTGRVVKPVLTPEGKRAYEFEVNESIKGVSERKIVVDYPLYQMCDEAFLAGEEMLIYASSSGNGRLQTYNFCSRNSPLSYAQGQLAFLRRFRAGQRSPQVYGFVGLHENPGSLKRRVAIPLANHKVMLAGKQKTLNLLTNADGTFGVSGLLPGRYTLTTAPAARYEASSYTYYQDVRVLKDGTVTYNTFGNDLPEDRRATDASRETEPSSGVYHEFHFEWPNKFEGKVLDLEGMPVNNADIMLLPVEDPRLPITFGGNRFSNGFYLGGQRPGKYVLGGIVNAPLDGKTVFAHFYPAASEAKSATVFHIEGPESRTINFVFPVKQRTITGTVLWSDKTPIRGSIDVHLTSSPNSPYCEKLECTFYSFGRADGASVFSVNAYVNGEYWVHVTVDAEDSVLEPIKERRGVKVAVKPFKIKVGEINDPIEVLVPIPTAAADGTLKDTKP